MNYQNLPVSSYQLGHLEKEAKNFHSQPGWVWWHKLVMALLGRQRKDSKFRTSVYTQQVQSQSVIHKGPGMKLSATHYAQW